MKYVPGLMVGQLSGKAGSTVASRNKGGSYFRTRVIPKHVVNDKTTAVRASFGSNAQGWSLLSDAQRLAWNSLGAQVTKKTTLGETIHLSGIQTYQMVNRNAYTTGFGPIFDAPEFNPPDANAQVGMTVVAGAAGSTTVIAGAASATQNVTSTADMFVGQSLLFQSAGVFREVVSITDPTHVVLSAPVTSATAEVVSYTELPTFDLSLTTNPTAPGASLVIFATGPLSPGVSRPSRGQFRLLEVIGAGNTSPLDEAAKYVREFGQPPAGSKIFVRTRYISDTGFAGAESSTEAVVS